MESTGMGPKQLLDALSDHLAIYHRSIKRPQTDTDLKGSARDRVLEWMSGLTVEQRQATLTIADRNWVAMLLQMQQRLEREGAGYFFLLIDVLETEPMNANKDGASKPRAQTLRPEQDLELKRAQKSHKAKKRMAAQTSSNSSKPCQDVATVLPSLCFRRAKGLLARLNEQQVAGDLLSRSLKLFSSRDGEAIECNDEGLTLLDTVCVRGDLVKNFDQFLAVMDVITHGEFLTSVAGRGGSSWEEVPWLKAMGYYTLPAFIANKLELAVWSAWLQAEGTRRPARMLAKELRKTGRSIRACQSDGPLTALTSTFCRRNKSFTDWWINLNGDVKSRALRYAVARAAKMEVFQAMRVAHNAVNIGTQHITFPVGRLKALRAQGGASRKMYFSDSDSEQGGFKVLKKARSSWPVMVGLSAIKELSTSGLLFAFPEGANVSQPTEYDWLFHSSLESADTLSGHVIRRARNALQKVMVESLELDLLRNESMLDESACIHSKDGEVKGKKEKRRKQIRNSAQSKVQIKLVNEVAPLTSELLKEQLESHISQATDEQMHKVAGKHMIATDGKPGEIENCDEQKQLEVGSSVGKQNMTAMDRKQGKKKICGRAKAKAAKENCFTMPVSEGKDDPSCNFEQGKTTETENTGSAFTCAEKASGTACADSSSQEPTSSGNQLAYCPDLQTVQSATSVSHHCEMDEHCISSSHPVEAVFSHTVGPGIENVANHGNPKSPCKSLDKHSLDVLDEEKITSLISNEAATVVRTLSALPMKTAAMSSSTERSCEEVDSIVLAKENTECSGENVDLTTHRKFPRSSDIKEVQCVPSPAWTNSLSSKIYSRSSCSSPTTRDSYSHAESLKTQTLHTHRTPAFGLSSAHEWPRTIQVRFSGGRSQIMPPATERLHLDVDRNWQQRLQASLMALRSPGMRQQSGTGGNSKRSNGVQNSLKSLDCPPIFQAGYNLTQTMGFIPFSQSSFPSGFAGTELNGPGRVHDESKHDDRTPEDTDYDDSNYFSGDFDDHEGYIISEEEGERQFIDPNHNLDADYNQIFGGGVMYWNTADYAGTGYSRPPSLSSEDSSWARHEADLSVVLDDIMGLSPMSGTFANTASPNLVSTSPPTASYHSGFDHNAVATTPRVGLPMSGSEFSGKFPSLSSTALTVKSEDEQNKGPNAVGTLGVLEGLASDIVTRPVLRPIIVVRDPSLSRQVSVSESIRHQEARSPHVPRGRRELPRRRRPPSPVLRCVPPAPPPPPPPPSPVGGFGKRRGFTTVRSGSSSPRHWGLGNWSNKEELDGIHAKSGAPEAATNAWRSRSITNTPSMHPISGALLRERLIAIPPLALEQEHPDVALPMQTALLFNSNPSLQSAITRLHSVLHEEIEGFCKQVAAENLLREPFIRTAVNKVAHAMQVLWPRSRLKIFGSNATGLALPCSDVDLVVCLPPVRNLEPIKEAGILEGRNGIKETCLQHAARYLADQDWVKGDSLKTIENTAIPIIMLVTHVPSAHYNLNEGGSFGNYPKPHLKEAGIEPKQVLMDVNTYSVTSFGREGVLIPSTHASLSEDRRGPWGGNADRELVRLDISFEAPSHTGLRTAELVRELTGQFPAIVPLALVLKQFLTDRSLDHPYTGGLSSYCLVLLITRFLQHQHHLGWPFQQNLGSLLMDFLHFFGCVFDPRRMGVCIRGGGMYVNRDRGHCIDPLHIEDPLHPSNNVGRNCFRILQCVKAFADAYSYFEKDLVEISDSSRAPVKGEGFRILPKILPSVASLYSKTLSTPVEARVFSSSKLQKLK